MDDTSKGNPGDTGVGGVLRNGDGLVLGCFSIEIGRKLAFEAEVEAILCALKFCKEFNVKNLSTESDSSIAMGWVSNVSSRPLKLINKLNVIDFLQVEVNYVDVSHIYRKANVFADGLAKQDYNRESPIWALKRTIFLL